MKVCAKGTKTLPAHSMKFCLSQSSHVLKKERAKMKVCAKGTKTLPAHSIKVASLKLSRYLTGVQRAGPLGSPSSGRGI